MFVGRNRRRGEPATESAARRKLGWHRYDFSCNDDSDVTDCSNVVPKAGRSVDAAGGSAESNQANWIQIRHSGSVG